MKNPEKNKKIKGARGMNVSFHSKRSEDAFVDREKRDRGASGPAVVSRDQRQRIPGEPLLSVYIIFEYAARDEERESLNPALRSRVTFFLLRTT